MKTVGDEMTTKQNKKYVIKLQHQITVICLTLCKHTWTWMLQPTEEWFDTTTHSFKRRRVDCLPCSIWFKNTCMCLQLWFQITYLHAGSRQLCKSRIEREMSVYLNNGKEPPNQQTEIDTTETVKTELVSSENKLTLTQILAPRDYIV